MYCITGAVHLFLGFMGPAHACMPYDALTKELSDLCSFCAVPDKETGASSKRYSFLVLNFHEVAGRGMANTQNKFDHTFCYVRLIYRTMTMFP